MSHYMSPFSLIYARRHKRKKEAISDFLFRCGERGIRTPGTSQYAGFQDRCIRPLCHLSNKGNAIDVVLQSQ